MQASKVNWRPLKDVSVFNKETEEVIYWGEKCGISPSLFDVSTHYAIIEKPVVKRELRRCPFPTCDNSDLEIAQFGCIRFCVQCRNCDSHGPIENTPERAKESWGYE